MSNYISTIHCSGHFIINSGGIVEKASSCVRGMRLCFLLSCWHSEKAFSIYIDETYMKKVMSLGSNEASHTIVAAIRHGQAF